MTARRYLDALEYDLSGQTSRVHAVAYYDEESWLTTACGLAVQAYPSTGTLWAAVEEATRCGRCAAALEK